jgi:flagellar motor switch protein FliM
MANKKNCIKDKNGIKPVNLTQIDKVVREKLPALDIINDRFTRELKKSLSHHTKEIISTSLTKSDLLKKETFFTTILVPSCIGIFNIPELFSLGLLIFDPQLAYGLLNSLYGGGKKSLPLPMNKEFTKVEISTMTTLVNMILKDLEHSWHDVYSLTFTLDRLETTPQLIGLAHEKDLIQLTTFEVEGESFKGTLTIAIPYKTMAPIKEKLKAKTFLKF